MVPVHLYNVVCVRDWTTSQKWFEVFFGRPADELIGEECPWQAAENAWVVIDDRYMRAARAGGTMITIGVTDLDDILARLAAHRIKHEPAETYGNGVRHVEVLDPDGNSLSLAEMPAERAGRFPFVRRKARPGTSRPGRGHHGQDQQAEEPHPGEAVTAPRELLPGPLAPPHRRGPGPQPLSEAPGSAQPTRHGRPDAVTLPDPDDYLRITWRHRREPSVHRNSTRNAEYLPL
jgi:hypothetical protein